MVGSDISHILDVGSVSKYLVKFSLIDNLLSRGVHKTTSLRHKRHKIVADRANCLRSRRNMQRNKVTKFVHLLQRLCRGHTLFCNLLCRNERVKCHNLHAESLGLLSHETAHISISLDSYSLALNLHTCARSKLVARHIDHHCNHKLSHSICILARCVHCHDTFLSTSRKIKIIVTCTCTNNDLQVLCSGNNLCRNLV